MLLPLNNFLLNMNRQELKKSPVWNIILVHPLSVVLVFLVMELSDSLCSVSRGSFDRVTPNKTRLCPGSISHPSLRVVHIMVISDAIFLLQIPKRALIMEGVRWVQIYKNVLS